MALVELSAGQIVADKYRIERVIGSGGMGVVVAATHVELDQRVAIKLLRDVNDEALARFQREARLLVRLKNPHVARVFDVGALDDDTPYIVMELLDGEDLGAILNARGRLSIEEAVDYVLEACEAIAEAHALGMVHRDLKPANFFVARGPGSGRVVKVLDFGVSKMLDQRPPSEQTTGGLTNEGVALGTPGYMSPEQMASSHDVDARADIFSLGAILYRLVSGQAPYKGNSLVSVLASMAMEPLPALRSVAPDVPEPFAKIVEQCLAQDREGRPPTVAALAEMLAPFASRRGRASVDSILATMHLSPSQPPRASVPSSSGVRPEMLNPTIVRPLTHPSFPPLVPAISSQSTTALAPSESRGMALGLALATFALVLGVVTFFVVRERPVDPPPGGGPTIAASTVALETATIPATETAPAPTPTAPAASATATTIATTTTTAKPAHTVPTKKPHGGTRPTSNQPPPPPSPTEVPSSRR